jgi:flagellar secretion chaperone FliS
MTYATQAAQYREMQVMTASPEQLVVVLFDHVLVTLRRARAAIETFNVDVRIEYLHKSKLAIGELLVTLNHEKGGVIAKNLAALYTFLMTELTDIGRHPGLERLDRVTGIINELRTAFATIAGEEADAA